jgi:hypothetical protein
VEVQEEMSAASQSIQTLVQRAQAGDHGSVIALRSYLDANPAVWQSAGDLAAQTEKVLISIVSGSDLLRAECLIRKLEALKADLAGPNPTPVEKLVIARIAIAWLQVHSADLEATAMLIRDNGATTLSVYAQKRLDSANRRYLQCLRSLEILRRINRPKQAPRARRQALAAISD